MSLVFHKMHGLGNDFVVLDLRRQRHDMDAEAARALADRKTGVGCDQVLVLRPGKEEALAAFEIWNADGSVATQCGNGARCLGAYLDARGETPQGPFVLQSPSGPLRLECHADGQVQVAMGVPRFAAAAVPVKLPVEDGRIRLDVAGTALSLSVLSMGNPHAVLEVEDLAAAPVETLGAAISHHPAFPEGCNVGFAEIAGADELRLAVYERGAGPTRACGSGACAAMVAARHARRVDATVRVIQPGGVLTIHWKGEDEPVMMTGPATHVFEGKLG